MSNPPAAPEPLPRGTLERERSAMVRALRAAGRSDKHDDLRSYLGSPLPTLGVYARDMVAIERDFRHRHPRLHPQDLHRLAAALWAGRTFEERILGCQLLLAYPMSWTPATWVLAGRWVDQAEGWGLCDTLAGGPVSRMLEAEPSRFGEVQSWTRSPNLWRRRAALYALNRWVRTGHLDRPFDILRRLRRDPEPWVQRAVGTWLRECWKKDRARTERFLEQHAGQLPPTVLTIATERAPRAYRVRLRGLARPAA
jgi:3-methyladenine DNA glycosylase AlkD